VLDPKSKSYFEIEFPPKQGQMAAMMAASTNAALNFKKSGTTREVAGFKCTDYDGGGHMMTGDYTVKECFSTRPPGAQEYAAFEKNMADKLKSAGPVNIGEAPGGMPLALDSSMKMGNINLPGMSADQAAKINAMMAKRPPVVTNTVVEKKLAESDFEVPSDFTKRELPTPGKMRMSPMKMAPPAGAPAAGASPAAH
jgi:hypothetical protein